MTRSPSSEEHGATTRPPLSDAVRALADELRREPLSSIVLNRISMRVDRLGRRLHGIDWVRGREIGACLTAAVAELSRARERPAAERPGSVRRALHHLEGALTHAEEGVRPDDTAPVAPHRAEVPALDG